MKSMVDLYSSREVRSLNCPKQCIFCNFALASTGNLSKNSVNVQEILGIKTTKTMLTQQKFNKIFQFQTLIYLKQ